MTHQIRRLWLVMLAFFVALFVSTSVIQVVQADALSAHERNRRALYDSYQVERGAILAGDTTIAFSEPSNDVYAYQRVYPAQDAAMWAAVTGWFNPVIGSSRGIEQAANAQLSGTSSSQFLQRLEQIVSGQKPQGGTVQLSLDPAVQKAAWDALGDLQGAVVAIEPSTGRILAMVSKPAFDPNTLATHDDASVNTSYAALEANAQHPLDNRAIGGNMNPPGSTFKLVVASAALSSGKYTPESTFPNPARFTLPGTSTEISNFTGGACSGGGDTVTLADALRFSCNIPMAELAIELGGDAIRDEAEKYGFDHVFETPLASTASTYPSNAMSPDQVGLTGFGQYNVRATPLQMAMVAAGIANAGSVMNPTMIDRVIAPDLSVQQQTEPSEFRRALSTQDAASMTAMMVQNVSNGVASGARIGGVDVAGKTGTAENGPGNPYTFWFTGFAPAADPKVAVAVVVENGGGLGQEGLSNVLAAPVGKAVMEAVLNR